MRKMYCAGEIGPPLGVGRCRCGQRTNVAGVPTNHGTNPLCSRCIASRLFSGKVSVSTLGNFGELIGLENYREQRETFAATRAIKRIGTGVVIDVINMATSEETVSDERTEVLAESDGYGAQRHYATDGAIRTLDR